MRAAKRRKRKKLGRLERLDRTSPRWPRSMAPGSYDHAYTDGDIVVLVSVVDTEHFGPVTHLWIRDAASSTHWPWYLLQEIKDRICGEHCEAVEVFPRRDDLVDSANMRHLWVFETRYRLPFGLASHQQH